MTITSETTVVTLVSFVTIVFVQAHAVIGKLGLGVVNPVSNVAYALVGTAIVAVELTHGIPDSPTLNSITSGHPGLKFVFAMPITRLSRS